MCPGTPSHMVSHARVLLISGGKPGHRARCHLCFPGRVEEPESQALHPRGAGSEPFGVLAQLGKCGA